MYHSPMFGAINFSKPKGKSYERQTWSYDRGDYNLLQHKAATTRWDLLYDYDMNLHAQNLSNHIIDRVIPWIPNRITRIRP